MPIKTAALAKRLHFGGFQFDVATGELFSEGQRVRLQEQPRQLLAALLERPGDILTREELRERLWKADTFVDVEHSLNTAIKKVRRALDDAADAPQYVETIARRGYRFIAPVTSVEAALTAAGPAVLDAEVPVGHSPVQPARRQKRRAALAAALLLAAAAVLLWFAPRVPPTQFSSSSPPTAAQLAVMPLRMLNAADDEELSYLGIAIADAITTRLANIRQIALRPTTAVLPYKDVQSELPRVAASLGVQHLLLGTVQPTRDAYRVSVQLVRADGVVVWGRSYDEPRAELLRLQDRIAEQVVDALRLELSPPERARLHVRYTANPAAYDLYLRGRALLVNYTETNMREAIARFEQALALDEDYALARAGLATASAWFSVRYAYESQALAWGKRADQEAHRALDQDASLADAHLAIASAAGTLYGGFNWQQVLDGSAAALALDPSIDLAHVVRMRALYHLGLFDSVRHEAQRARALNPTPNVEVARLEVASQLFAGHFEAAAEQATALLQRTDAPAIRQYLGLARYYLGDASGALDMLTSVTRGGQADVRAQASLASIEAATGLGKQARERVTAIAGGPYMDHHVAYSLGAAFAQLGDTDASLMWLQQAADTGFPCSPWFERDPLLAPIRADARFARLLERMRNTYEQARSLPSRSS